ncbi:hypothetical protein N7E81_07555 [Reichenbachiella carrageenanivorans]|uniref:YceI-like domain-containing protein n=1 Tax=Reichenbachiella carrageenanivorans TaxID=2979869 RepID=A0ABY6D466_9BACT|nr:hypothetical protein [Reichenbachiella carrageenanivorans]UXX80954.1 hypothetical protein N7E81_07555 [Reichenbachiella carrageenanivorans]
MKNIKAYLSKKHMLSSACGVVCLLTLSSFVAEPVTSELTLNMRDEPLLVFTHWQFTDFKIPDQKLENLSFTAHVEPVYKINKRVFQSLDHSGVDMIVINVYEAAKKGENQYMAKADIVFNDMVINGYFLYGCARGNHSMIEGRFETEDNLIMPNVIAQDLNYVLKTKLTKRIVLD